MSIWASVGVGEPPLQCLDSEFGSYPDPDGWIDVATGWGAVRLIVVDNDGEGRVALSTSEARRLIDLLERAIVIGEQPHREFNGRWRWSKKRGCMVLKWKNRKVKP